MPNHEQTLVESGQGIQAHKENFSDRGRRRHLIWGMDFDSRSVILAQEIGEHWDERTKELWRKNQARVREELKVEFGELGIEGKIKNFIALDSKPFSILSYHNRFFHQVRHAYVIGAYFPALVGACALGERILNHLMIDLRHFFCATPEYRRIYRKKSFDDWDVPIDTLLAWGVLLPDVADELRLLKSLRHRSIHFNVETYLTLKDDALAAILHLRSIINRQFGTFGAQPWFIKGTKGHQFISREWESHPFIQTYFLHSCPFVGPFLAWSAMSKVGNSSISLTTVRGNGVMRNLQKHLMSVLQKCLPKSPPPEASGHDEVRQEPCHLRGECLCLRAAAQR